MHRRRALALACCAPLMLAAAGDQPADPEPDWAAIRRSLGEAMQRLEPLLGEWDAQGTMGRPNEAGVSPPQHGTWTNRWLLGEGKHLELRFDVFVGDEPSHWLAIVSYNPFREQYESVWIGSGGYRFAETGNFDSQGRLVLTSRQDGPDLANPTTNVSVFEFHDDGTITVTDTQTDKDTPEPVVSFFVRLTRRE